MSKNDYKWFSSKIREKSNNNNNLRNRRATHKYRSKQFRVASIDPNMTSIAGYLKQRGDGKFIKSWYNRYCILDKDCNDNKLWIYKSKQDHLNRFKPVEIIFIEHIESDSIKVNKDNPVQFTFWIKNDQRSQFFLFESLSELQCATWCEKLIANRKQRKNKRKSIKAMRKIAIFNKRSAEVSISSLKADRDLYVGWCKSELSRKNYQSRYFVLTSVELRYWRNNVEYQSNKPPKVCIPLHLICDLQKITNNSLQICVQFQDPETGNYKMRLFELQHDDEQDINNFYSGLSSSNWRRQELKERNENQSKHTLIRRLPSKKIFGSPKKNEDKKPSQSLLKREQTMFFRINAPEVDRNIDDDASIDEIIGGKSQVDNINDIELESENTENDLDSYAQLKKLWSNDVGERKSILKRSNSNNEKRIKNRVEFSSNTNIISDLDLSYEGDSDTDESSYNAKLPTHRSLCYVLYESILKCCKTNSNYNHDLQMN